MERKGIDISVHNGVVDFEKLKPAVDFVIIRAGYGSGHIDKQAVRNISECKRLNIPFGLYWFSYAPNETVAQSEAQAFADFVKAQDARPEYPLYFDWEYDSRNYCAKIGYNIGKAQLTRIATKFCSTLELNGFYAAIYTNRDYYTSMFDPAIWNRFDRWIAYYNKECFIKNPTMWQTSSTGRVPGLSGNVDTDKCMRDYPTIIKKAGLNGYTI